MAQHVLNVPITKCSYVAWNNPSTNYGTATTLKTGGYFYRPPAYDKYGFDYVILIDWNKSNLPILLDQEGTNKKRYVSSKLKLYSLVTLQGKSNIEMGHFPINFSWDENTIKYSQMPSLNFSNGFSEQNHEVNANSYFELNLKENVLYGEYGPFGIMLLNTCGILGAGTILEINSTRAVSNKPYIELIYEDVAPLPPTLITPKSETKRNSEVIRFEWQYQSEANDTQTKFDLQWSSNRGQTWNTITQSTSNEYYDMPADTLPVGDIVWKVRTYSAEGLVGEYSDQAAFVSAGKPDTPVLTSPSDIENTSRPVIAWTGVGQVMYQAQVLQGEIIVWNSGEVASTAEQVQVGADLADNTSYTAKVRIKNQYDLWSDWASKAFTVDFELPNKPAFEIVKDLVRASVRLTITNPTPDGAGGFAHNDIYRRKVGGSWIRIATGIERNGTYEDCAMASSQPYEYMVRTIGTFGYMDSDVKYADIRVKNSQLASITDKDIYVPLIYNPQRNISLGMGRTLMQFAGRKKPVAEFSEHIDLGMVLSFVMKDIEDIDTLMALVESAETLLYRDNRGRKIYCTIGSLDIDEERKYWTVSFTIAEVSYQEGV